MRWYVILLAIFAAVMIACSSNGGGDDEANIRETLEGFAQALNDSDFTKAYSYFSEECQDNVSLSEFSAGLAFAALFFGEGELEVSNIRIIELTGDRAIVDAEITITGVGDDFSVEEDQDPIELVKEDGRWRTTDCEEGSTESGFVVPDGDDATPVTGPGTSRAEALPLGDSILTPSGLEVRVLAVDKDAWPVVEAENSFNDPPKPGKRMVLITVEVANRSTQDETVSVSVAEFSLTGSNNTVYDPYDEDSACGIIPDELRGELFPDGAASGNVCFQVPEDETGLILIVDTFFSFDQSDRRYLALE
ncbi:MAG: DUF4352 domain-containing protein [Chloroflexi bacterium]|nr:DUF4352 domain-containing protein [Chloroflexota bacterium]